MGRKVYRHSSANAKMLRAKNGPENGEGSGSSGPSGLRISEIPGVAGSPGG